MLSSQSGRHLSQSDHTSVRRPDLGLDAQHHREVALDDDAARALGVTINDAMDDEDDGRRLFIYGTKICVMDVKHKFLDFLQNFQTNQLDDDERGMAVNADDMMVDLRRDSNYYIERLMEIELTENPILNVNLKHVSEYDDNLYQMIVAYPAVSCFLPWFLNDRILLRKFCHILTLLLINCSLIYTTKHWFHRLRFVRTM